MGFRLSAIVRAKQVLQLSPSATSQAASNVPKGCLAVYVGEIQKKRFVIVGLLPLHVQQMVGTNH
jgi:SAUR family protein